MKWWRHRWGRRLQALGVPLLAAVLLHGLLLAAASLRSPRTAGTPPLRPDDTPELLVFSRLPPEPLPTSEVPLPPPEVLPAPPPPPLPARPSRLRGQPLNPAASRASRTRSLPKARTGRPAIARGSAPARRPASRAPQRPALATASPKDPTASPTAAASSPPAEAAAPWRLLWQGAEGGDALPAPPEALAAALAVAPPQTEVRRLPLQRARQQGVAPESGQLLRLDGHRLLLWIEGGELWLLRTPA